MTSPEEPLALRVGDAERDQTASELQAHHLAGRLDDGELEERLGGAYAARTVGDLLLVLGDLPDLGRRAVARESGRPPAAAARVRGYGLAPFSYEHDSAAPPAEAYSRALDLIGSAMLRFGYDLVERVEGQSLVFEDVERPAWVPLVCIAAFPVGLLALLATRRTRVRVEVMPGAGGGSRIRVSGEARRSVRKAFADLAT